LVREVACLRGRRGGGTIGVRDGASKGWGAGRWRRAAGRRTVPGPAHRPIRESKAETQSCCVWTPSCATSAGTCPCRTPPCQAVQKWECAGGWPIAAFAGHWMARGNGLCMAGVFPGEDSRFLERRRTSLKRPSGLLECGPSVRRLPWPFLSAGQRAGWGRGWIGPCTLVGLLRQRLRMAGGRGTARPIR